MSFFGDDKKPDAQAAQKKKEQDNKVLSDLKELNTKLKTSTMDDSTMDRFLARIRKEGRGF